MAKKPQESTDFVGFFKNNPKALQNLKGMKDAQNPNEQPDIADGTYVARVSSVKTSFRKVPRITIRMVVDRGAFEGTQLSRDYALGQLSDKSTLSDQEIYERCAVDLITIGASRSCFDDPQKLKEEVERLGKERPLIRIGVKTNAKGYLNIYLNGLVEEDNAASPDDVEADDEDADVEEEEDQETEGSEGTDDGPETPVEVGDRVRFQPKGGRKSTYSVTKSDEDNRTCDLKDVTGKTVKGVAWDSVEFVVS